MKMEKRGNFINIPQQDAKIPLRTCYSKSVYHFM
jgi:hypothetical protein